MCKPALPYLSALTPLWPLGVAAALLVGVLTALPSSGELREWQGYIVLGALLPPLAWSISARSEWVRWLCGAGALVALAWTSAADPLYVLGLADLRLPWIGIAVACGGAAGWAAQKAPRSAALQGLALYVVGWCIFSRLMWWQSFARMFEGPGAAPVGMVAAAGISWALLRDGPASRRGVDVAACLLFAFLASRTTPIDVHHWAFLAGPANVVRHGGLLLWDTPAQYGQALPLLLALAGGSVWSALTWVTGISNAAYATVLYATLSRLRATLAMQIAALLVVTCSVFWLIGNPPDPQGPQQFPMVGGMRFLGPTLMAAWPFWAERRRLRPHITLIVSGILWLLGSLWSFDSAVWCTCIGWPAALTLHLQTYRSGRRAVAFVCLGIAAWVGTWMGIAAVYAVLTGHLPDGRCFFEYALAYGEGFGAAPINIQTAVGALLGVFALAVGQLVTQARQVGIAKIAPSMVAACALVWTASSYFIGRSVDHNAVGIIPMVLLGAGVVLHHATRASAERTLHWMLAPLLSCVVCMALCDIPHVEQQLSDTVRANTDLPLGRLVPADADLQALVLQGGVGCDAPIAFVGPSVPGIMPPITCRDKTGSWVPMDNHRPLLPNEPTNLLGPLPDARRRVYLQRYLERTQPAEGWVVTAKPADKPWLQAFIAENFVTSATWENTAWRLQRVLPRAY